jgi:ABC-type cobalt transport system substrate-binding protein
MKSGNTMKKRVIGQSLMLALGIAVASVGSVHAAHKGFEHGNGSNKGNSGNTPQLSVDVAAYCGNPGDQVLDESGAVIHTFGYGGELDDENVVVFFDDTSGDFDPENPPSFEPTSLEVECLKRTTKGKFGYTPTGQTHGVTGFGKYEFNCSVNIESGDELKVTVTAEGESLDESRSDNCEEVILN